MIKRKLLAAIDRARESLRIAPPVPDEAVHDARKCLKKARAALRLLRSGLGEASYRAQNVALRDAGRCLSPLRDAKSLLDALEALRRRYASELRGVELGRLQRRLRANHAKARRELFASPARLQNCIQLLDDCRRQAEQADVSRLDCKAFRSGLRRIYRKGRKAFAEAKPAGTPGALHEWRKQVKYLQYAIEILFPAQKGKLARLVKRADKLAARLGEDHDLALLSQQTQAMKALQALIQRRRAKLQKRAFALGEKLYDKKPGRFP